MRIVLNFFLFSILINCYFISAIIAFLLLFWNKKILIKTVIQIASTYCGIFLKLLNIKVEIASSLENSIPKNTNYLIVCNHLSYVDVLILNNIFPSCFITSKEIQQTPFLGWICTLSGCIFINRKNHKKIIEEIKQVENILAKGFNVTLFPEGTSTNGMSVLNFKKPLFQSAINTGVKILPLCLNYTHINSVPLNTHNRDHLFWYGDATFFSHLIKLFSCKLINVKLNILDEICPENIPDKLSLSKKSHDVIKSQYIPINPLIS